MSPTTAGLPAPKSKAVQLGVLGALGLLWGSVGVLWGVLKGSVAVLPCPPHTGVPSIQEVLEGLGAG